MLLTSVGLQLLVIMLRTRVFLVIEEIIKNMKKHASEAVVSPNLERCILASKHGNAYLKCGISKIFIEIYSGLLITDAGI